MPSIKGVIKGAYHASQLLFSLLWVLIYLRWSMWRAKKSFAGELIKHGVPKDIARELTASYNERNKNILKQVLP